jgi:flagellar FliL protein
MRAKTTVSPANPAKDSGRPGAGKYLLTIPTYLRFWGAWDRAAAMFRQTASHAGPSKRREVGSSMAAKAKQADFEEPEEDGRPEGESGQPSAKSKFAFLKFKLPSMKWMIIGGAGLLVLVGGGGGAYFFFKGSGHKEPQVAAKPATFVDMPDVLVNLSSSGADRTQYLKVKIVLELPDATLVPQIQPLMPRVMDAFQTYLRELRPTDLDGSAGLYRLKEELTRRVNAAVAPNRITAVLFKEIVVQ